MTIELTYLFFSALLLALAWIPHIVGQIMTSGLLILAQTSQLGEQKQSSESFSQMSPTSPNCEFNSRAACALSVRIAATKSYSCRIAA